MTLALRANEVVPAEQARHEHRVTKTRDGKEFRYALEKSHDDGLKVGEGAQHSNRLNGGPQWSVRSLLIVRHAKATPALAGAPDVERSLSERGVAQCAQLRAWASDPHELGRFGPVVALVSAARRTRETFDLAFRGTPLVHDVVFSEAIYNGVADVSADDLLRALAEHDDGEMSLMVVAHNPSVLELLWTFSDEWARDGFRTGSAYVIELAGFTRVEVGSGELVAHFVPA